MWFTKSVNLRLSLPRFLFIGCFFLLHFIFRTHTKSHTQKTASSPFSDTTSSDIELKVIEESSNGCGSLQRVLDAPVLEDTPMGNDLDKFPEYIFMTFFVDGLFTQATSRKYSGKKETVSSKKMERKALPVSIMVGYLHDSISLFHKSFCLVVRTNNASLFKTSRDMLVFDDDVSVLPSYTSTKIAEQQKFYNKIFSAISKKKTVLTFLDPDMLLMNNLEYMKEEASTFDIAVTVRDYTKMPINAGFFAISGQAKQVLVDKIFSDMIDTSKNLSTVFADQIALLSVFRCEGHRNIHRITYASGLKVLCLPASIYNASPRDIHTKISKSTKILHFKGDRKFYQQEVRNLLLKQKSSKAALQLAMNIR